MATDHVVSLGKTVCTFIHGDCLPAMRDVPAESVDVVVTSPPYNLGIKYSTYSDTMPRKDYINWTLKWCKEVERLIKPHGSFFLNIGSSPSNPMLPHEIVIALRELFVLQNTFHWIKSITVARRGGEEISVGHFKPINSNRFVTDCHEYVFHLTPKGKTSLNRLAVGVRYADKSNVTRWTHTGGRDKRCRGNSWFIPYNTIQEGKHERPHPATFPVQLAEWCIKVHGNNEKLTVLDPFLGIGNSAVAARRCHVARFIGIEIDEKYVTLACRSLQS